MFNKIFNRKFISIFLTLFVAIGMACSGQEMGGGGTTEAGGNISLQGSGASFPKPIYEKWVSEYGKLNPKIKIDYQAVGSGGGRRDS